MKKDANNLLLMGTASLATLQSGPLETKFTEPVVLSRDYQVAERDTLSLKAG